MRGSNKLALAASGSCRCLLSFSNSFSCLLLLVLAVIKKLLPWQLLWQPFLSPSELHNLQLIPVDRLCWALLALLPLMCICLIMLFFVSLLPVVVKSHQPSYSHRPNIHPVVSKFACGDLATHQLCWSNRKIL